MRGRLRGPQRGRLLDRPRRCSTTSKVTPHPSSSSAASAIPARLRAQ
jgi:hypothetical protein